MNLRIPGGSPPTLEQRDEAVTFISEALADPNSRVFVHCRGGQERTATVLVAWYAQEHGTNYVVALEELRRRRDVFRPTRGHEAVTREWIQRRIER